MSMPSSPPPTRTPASVLLLCLACMTLEGYDVIAYGAALPAMLADRTWHLGIGQASLLGTLTPIGMLAGALLVGVLTDLVGRRRLVLASVALFSAAMLLCAAVPSVPLFAIGRVLVGLGVGGVLPSIAALVYEYSPQGRRNLNTALAFAGVGLGGALAAIVAATAVPGFGFRAEYLIGGLGALAVLPVAFRSLPESRVFLAGQQEPAKPRFAVLFARAHLVATVLFCLTTFASLLVLFGLYTWLPQLMRSAGYQLGSALGFLIVLNLGTAVGPLLVGRLADRIGSQRAIAGSFLLAVVGISVLSYPLPTMVLYVAVVLAGVGTVGTQILINVFVASRYPVHTRATAVGLTLSVGRLGGILGPLYGGALLSAHLPTAMLFYGFAIPALAGAVLVVLVPRARAAASTVPEQPGLTISS
ncbi:MFS transporter [Amycolatopsis benzoatilytica]|uniref:MFS transporter n=1 Tax=Amycolatopsis benzoatilytica TaxID=346045 RepID=UPI00038062D3|nr:MFS transporter [Amycolatopsis benzoatilytica]